MKQLFFLTFFNLSFFITKAQFPPQAGIEGSDAIAIQDTGIIGWATGATVERGWKDIADTSLGKVTIGTASDVLGPADFSLLSLGDGGMATLTFEYSLRNGPGADFAVFENGFTHLSDPSIAFLELAFVEVSSDGEHFFRFPAISQLPNETQLTNDDFLNAAQIHNLAGKYINGYGTPFDLDELKNITGLDVNAVTHVRIIDVVGSIHPDFARYDSEGNVINDPYPTPFPAGGFDLLGVGVLNNNQPNRISDLALRLQVKIYPNPAQDYLIIETQKIQTNNVRYCIIDALGKRLSTGTFSHQQNRVSISSLSSGWYWMKLATDEQTAYFKFLKQ